MNKQTSKQSWVAGVLIISFGWFLLYATRTALSSALKDIGEYWSLSEGFLGFIASSFFFAYAVLQIPTGILADKFGARKMIMLGVCRPRCRAAFGGSIPEPLSVSPVPGANRRRTSSLFCSPTGNPVFHASSRKASQRYSHHFCGSRPRKRSRICSWQVSREFCPWLENALCRTGNASCSLYFGCTARRTRAAAWRRRGAGDSC